MREIYRFVERDLLNFELNDHKKKKKTIRRDPGERYFISANV